MLSIWCMVRRKVIGLVWSFSMNVMCSAIDIFLDGKTETVKTDTAVFCRKPTETKPETEITEP